MDTSEPTKLRLPFSLTAGAASPEHGQYLRRLRLRKISIFLLRAAIVVGFVFLWEYAARLKYIDPFITSQPSKVFNTLQSLYSSGELYKHTLRTLIEAILGFGLGITIGIVVAIMLWWSDYLSNVLDPYIVILNAIPKIALGPLFIIWLGTGLLAILGMTLAISIIITIMMVYSGFKEVSPEKMLLLRSFGATKLQVFAKVVFPASLPSIMSALKAAIGLSWVGVIVGEFLVSYAGLGYLIIYGGQVLNLHLVMASIVILSCIAALMYVGLSYLESRVIVWKE